MHHPTDRIAYTTAFITPLDGTRNFIYMSMILCIDLIPYIYIFMDISGITGMYCMNLNKECVIPKIKFVYKP